MAKPKSMYKSVSQLIEGEPNLRQIALIPAPGADEIMYYDIGNKEFQLAGLGSGLSISGGNLVVSGSGGGSAAFGFFMGT